MPLPDGPFLTGGHELAKRKAYDKYKNYDGAKYEVEEYVRVYIEDEMLKVNQARLTDQLDRVAVRRLLEEGQSKATDTSGKKTGSVHVSKRGRKFGISKKSKSGSKDCFENKLMMDRKSKVIHLAGVTIFPKVGGQDGETIVGTLQSHANGFIYATSGFSVSFLYKDVKKLFFLAEDGKETPPLLHFHMGRPIKIGTEKRRDIQFRLVPAPVGQRRSGDVSNKTVKEKQHGDEDLKIFVLKIEDKWSYLPVSYYPFEELGEMYEFHGVDPSGAWSVFGLTSFSLVRLISDTPFVVVSLLDIEIVNLAKLEPEKFYMTVVYYKDCKLNLLQIDSIPLHLLDDIKQCLDFGNVKYYVNNEKQECWGTRVKNIAKNPGEFIVKGGWRAFGLEDSETVYYYNCLKGSEKCYSDGEEDVEEYSDEEEDSEEYSDEEEDSEEEA